MPENKRPVKTSAPDTPSKLRYRLALDIGTSSLGWAMVRLTKSDDPCAIIRAGARIFSDGRNPKDGSSLAVTRRLARGARRRRDRFLRRKTRMMTLLIEYRFFPADVDERKALERLCPYTLRARGLDHALTGPEFGRALFHLNQRRGFRSNRLTPTDDTDKGPMKQAMAATRAQLETTGASGQPRTVGEWLYQRLQEGQPVRARMREIPITRPNGKPGVQKSYDLYIDRAMIAAEFDALWAVQAAHTPDLFTDAARDALRDCLLFQRPLRPVDPGRCTLLPDEPRAPKALPLSQRFRIYQEVNHLRLVGDHFEQIPLTLDQRDQIVDALERYPKRSFEALRKLLALPPTARFSIESPARKELDGNATSTQLAKKSRVGPRWRTDETPQTQETIVRRLLSEDDDDETVVSWLCDTLGVDVDAAHEIITAKLPAGYGHLSVHAMERILPHLQSDVISFAEATERAGFHHSQLRENAEVPGHTVARDRVDTTTGELTTWHVFTALPYYGEILDRYVGQASGRVDDRPEQRFGKIANPTVHVGLNQVRLIVNTLIQRYGHPEQVIIEVARDLKQSQKARAAQVKQQAVFQTRNQRLRSEAAALLGGSPEDVSRADLQKLILWEELNETDERDRRCPYSGTVIDRRMALSAAVEVDHILPFSRTLDDSLTNKTVSTKKANQVKGNRTPWDARDDFAAQGWTTDDMIARARRLPEQKRFRFAADAEQQWLGDGSDFLGRALNDTRYLSRVAAQYVRIICPHDTRVIPGRMTAMLRGKFGLNGVLGHDGLKNRDDHRHHAVDACVIGVTDQGLLQRFARASQSARERALEKLVETMPRPWETYRDHVARAVTQLRVSHKPDHSHEGAMHNATAYPLTDDGRIRMKDTTIVGIPIADASQVHRHGKDADGRPAAYKGFRPDSNYCMDIVRRNDGTWAADVVTTYDAYQAVRQAGGDVTVLRSSRRSLRGAPLVMRLIKGDVIRFTHLDRLRTMRVVKFTVDGSVTLSDIHEANVDARNRNKETDYSYTTKRVGGLQRSQARRVTVSPIGDLRDNGYKG